MLKIEKRALAELRAVYAVSTVRLRGETHFLAATEDHGEGLILSPPDWRSSRVWDGPGGVMSMVGIPGRPGVFLSARKFFPIFKSEDAEIAVTRWNEANKNWQSRKLVSLPFVHRIEVVEVGGAPYLVAGALCGGKAHQDDWSRPGAVYVAAIPDGDEGQLALETVMTGLSKNHGMYKTIVGGRQVVFVSGQEGVFGLTAPQKRTEAWRVERVLEHEVSDVCVCDIDGDGSDEMLTIAPFHGNRMSIHKRIDGKWTEIFSKAIDFGHLIWGGKIAGRPGIIVGSRGGRKDLEIVYPKFAAGGVVADEIVLDGGVGPAQIVVISQADKTLVLSSNHAVGEVALYTLSAQGSA